MLPYTLHWAPCFRGPNGGAFINNNPRASIAGGVALTAVRPLLRGIEMAPALLQARMASRVWAKGCHPDEFVLALPLLIPALVVCAFGEWVECLAGPGNALHKVE